MEIVPLGPLAVASIVWQPGPRAFALTLVCKATFPLAPGEATLAPTQDPPTASDVHWSNDLTRSLSAPSDLAPLKVRADVILVGSAYAPRGEAVRSLIARLKVGEIDKSIEVFGDRSFSQDGSPMEGPRFTRMPLSWERAAGGPGTPNPVGMRADHKDAYGWTPIANLRAVGQPVYWQGAPLVPVGLGPIAPSWPSRRELLGPRAGTWPSPRWMEEPMPPDIDAGYFNAAPRDQQLDLLRDDETLVLENLHPQHPQLVMKLVGLHPRARVERLGAVDEEVSLRADTLFIDTDRGLCTLTWRGRVRLDHPSDPGRITIDIAPVRKVLKPGDALGTMMIGNTDTAPRLPFVAAPPEQSPMARPTAMTEGLSGLLAMADQMPAGSFGGTVAPRPPQRPATPFVDGSGAPASPPAFAPAPPPAPASAPAFAPAPPPAPASAPTFGPAPAPAPAPTFGPAPPPAPASAPTFGAVPVIARREEPAPEDPPTPAPASEPRIEAVARESVKLVWFDAEELPRIQKLPDWRSLLIDLESRLIDEAAADLGAGELRPEAKAKRVVREVLMRGKTISADGVRQAIDAATAEDGAFDPPLALFSAELEMPFDELETLKAIATAARPLGSTDKRLKEALDLVDELFASPWLAGSGGTAESLTTRVREAFAQARRTLSPDYLEVQAERRLLEQRAYQSRSIFGKKHLRATIPSATGPIPVYLPEATKDQLPMFRRFRVKLMAELDHREDQGEASPWAIKAIAIARVWSAGV